MLVWKIWGFSLNPVYIEACDLDSALERARKINNRYDLAKVVGIVRPDGLREAL